MNEPTFFKPHALAKAPIIREGRVIRDLAMPEQDWSRLDSPAYERIPARSVCAAQFGEKPRTWNVDHIDGNPGNNAWTNLRECTQAQNMQNKRTYRRNRSGAIGVSPSPPRCAKPWRATIKIDGRCHHLGTFDTTEEAHQRYLAAKRSMHKFNPVLREGAR